MKSIIIIFGGNSTEHEVSVLSAKSIIKNIDKEKYNIKVVYISKNGEWYECDLDLIRLPGSEVKTLKKITNIIEYLRKCDTIFPVLHGKNGEDGSIQGVFEIVGKPYIGCGILASALGMDKVYTKIIFKNAGFLQAKYVYIKKKLNEYILIDENFNEKTLDEKVIKESIIDKLKFPMFVKPSNCGSSIGIKRVTTYSELLDAIMYAGNYDRKILVEEEIIGRELECAVLDSKNIVVSGVGEIISAETYYSYDAKYNNKESKVIIPAKIDTNIETSIREYAKKAFEAIDGKGLSRVDFFYDEKNAKIYINEINTLPGFTNISMYPKLFEKAGIKYDELLEKIIENSTNIFTN